MTNKTSIATPSSLYQPTPSLEDCNQFVINHFHGKPGEQAFLNYWNENKQKIYQQAIQCKNTPIDALGTLTSMAVSQIVLLLLTEDLIKLAEQSTPTNNSSNP